ncbi:MAG: helix-turn-helix transcriptional regulator [Gammaproteobacteria bacterium]|nr:helix-turn-helix transcriptional regulator [Gammaproteobacteria bacterium]MYF02547.1 helix-turn-helix transcriptional regulator [Gammaproteobacteria bacterium]MYI77949.1 helix-turn-helix transcriptional regulator [Gammaproteobacteria bacterium]
MITLQELKARLMKDPQFQKEYEDVDAQFTLVESIIGARLSANLTQTEVAERMGTTQSAIARLEGGWVSPSFATLRRFAEATQTRVQIEFLPKKYLV